MSSLRKEIEEHLRDKVGGSWFTYETDQILSLIAKKVEGIENPYSDNVHLDHGVYDGLYRKRFNEAIQAVLNLLKEE